MMLRCIGAAPLGAVLVAGGAENVLLPRLPMLPPSPGRALTGARDWAKTIIAMANITVTRFKRLACLGAILPLIRNSPLAIMFIMIDYE